MAQFISKPKKTDHDTATPDKAHKNTKKNDKSVTPKFSNPQKINGVTDSAPAPSADASLKNPDTKTIWSKKDLSQWDAPDTSSNGGSSTKHTTPRNNYSKHQSQHDYVSPPHGGGKGGRRRGRGGAAPRGGLTQTQPTQRATQHFVECSHGSASITLDAGTTPAARQTAVGAMGAMAASFLPQAESATQSSGGSSGVSIGSGLGSAHSRTTQSGITQANNYSQFTQRHLLKQNEPSSDSSFAQPFDEIRQAVVLEDQRPSRVPRSPGRVIAKVIGIEDVTEELEALEAQQVAQQNTLGEDTQPMKQVLLVEDRPADEKSGYEATVEKETQPRVIESIAQKPTTHSDPKKDLRRVESDLAYSEQQLQDLQKKKNESDLEVAKLKGQINESSVELQAANKETDNLRTQLDEANIAKKPDAPEKVQKATSQIEAANRERDDFKIQLDQANKKIQPGIWALIDKDNAANEWSRAARIEFNDLTARARAMEDENMRLRSQIAGINDLVSTDVSKVAVIEATAALQDEKQALVEQARIRLDEQSQSFRDQMAAVRRELEEAKRHIPADTPDAAVAARTSASEDDKQAKAILDSRPCHVCGGLVPNSIVLSCEECARLQARVNDVEGQHPTSRYATAVSSPPRQTTSGITPCSTCGKPPAPPTDPDCKSCIRTKFNMWVARATKLKEERNAALVTVDELQGRIALRSGTLVPIDSTQESISAVEVELADLRAREVFLVANLEIANQETLSALERLYEAHDQMAVDFEPANEQENARLREQVDLPKKTLANSELYSALS
ncbi:hypothetical protein E4T42_04743 [Aureobasidium subglaciale]|nr:hypothetical protein E4T42_04743 [Aureobasidium subglaciale]